MKAPPPTRLKHPEALQSGVMVTIAREFEIRNRQNKQGAIGSIEGAELMCRNRVKEGDSWGGAVVGTTVGGLAESRRGKTNSVDFRPRHTC